MTRQAKDFTKAIGNITRFLIKNDWTPSNSKSGLQYFEAPQSLGITGGFSIALPVDPKRRGIDSVVVYAIETLSDIYHRSLNDLYEDVAATNDLETPTTLCVRFVDDKTASGVIPLKSLGAFIGGAEKSLFEAVKFKMGDESKATTEKAERFLEDCRFLQTKPGSFIASIEVPPVMLRQAQLFPEAPTALSSSQICTALFSAIEFITENVLKGKSELEDNESITQALELFNPELLEALFKLLIGPEMSTAEFSMYTGGQRRDLSTGIITPTSTGRFREFVKFIKDHHLRLDLIDVHGPIVELRSRDPQGNRNHIGIHTIFGGINTFVTATLNNEQYDRAMAAHRIKGAVRVRGRALQLKTQLRVTEIEIFELALG